MSQETVFSLPRLELKKMNQKQIKDRTTAQPPSKEKPRQNSRNPQVGLGVDDKTSNAAFFYLGHNPILFHFHFSIRSATGCFSLISHTQEN